jgi:hypothetical protein
MAQIMKDLQLRQDAQTTKIGARVTLGPGTYTTKGYSDDDPVNTSGWTAVPGLKIVGAGVDVTTIQLASVSTAAAQFYAVGHPLVLPQSGPMFPANVRATKVNHFEITELTIDANYAGNGASLGCGAVRVYGDHARIRRVKAINWGTKNSTKRCFVFAVITAAGEVAGVGSTEAVSCGMEDCTAILPGGATQPVTVFHAGAREEPILSSPKETHGTGPFIRNCYVSGESPAGAAFTPSPTGNIRALSMGACRGGVVENNQVINVDVGGPFQDRASARDIVVRGNVYKNVARGPYWKMGQLLALPTVTTAVRESVAAPFNLIVTTNSGHNLAIGDTVRLTDLSPTALNGVYRVVNVPQINSFKVQRFPNFIGDATVGSTTCKKLVAVGKVWILDNYMELAQSVGSVGIELDDQSATLPVSDPDYLYAEVMIRGNQIRYLDGPTVATPVDDAIRVSGVKKGSIRDNLVDSLNSTPVILRSPPGGVVVGDNLSPSSFIRQAEDALMMSLLDR